MNRQQCGSAPRTMFSIAATAARRRSRSRLTPPSEIPELPTQQEIEAELKRRGLPTVSELVAHERDRIRREAGDPASFAQQRRAAPPRDQLEMTVRQTCPAMDGNAQPSDLGDATSVELFHDSAGRSGAAPFQVKHSREDWRQRTFTM